MTSSTKFLVRLGQERRMAFCMLNCGGNWFKITSMICSGVFSTPTHRNLFSMAATLAKNTLGGLPEGYSTLASSASRSRFSAWVLGITHFSNAFHAFATDSQ